MSGATFFVQECPTCGRCLQIRLEYLGKWVACQHCQRKFEASFTGSDQEVDPNDSAVMMLRAEELLQSVESRMQKPR